MESSNTVTPAASNQRPECGLPGRNDTGADVHYITRKSQNLLDESGLENPAKPHLCNVIMKVKPEIRNILINELNGRVNIEYSYIHVEDMSPLRQCFHCFGFKHIAEYCPRKNRQICLHCGGEHLISECMNREDAPTCLNCRIEQLPSQRNHMATSRDCPVMLRIMKNMLIGGSTNSIIIYFLFIEQLSSIHHHIIDTDTTDY
ncbi:hypothetical protein DERF_009881 [Dermatophagoides farinae]|uniref:Nucleic-acid-binding protein from mobile element jockey n=1 Tax=Dermatophagoides farinae TaxID=6954 RepID=A0A922L1D5_DERFA|nr:hypothetical protein DERF_009881 [Dermatophagoides farinae]